MKNLKEKVSIIMPAYNENNHIISCVEETIRTFSEFGCQWELLIIDDGSTDDTEDVCRGFGDDRIKDTPICEQAIAGMAIGAALRGLRPIGVFMNSGFTLAAFDGLFLKIGCTFAPAGLPLVMQASIAGPREDMDHGMSPEALYCHSPYWKVVMPSTPMTSRD
jgi:pyruvate/2-oxoglutarate/acetoin dehydrogenase E1 component